MLKARAGRSNTLDFHWSLASKHLRLMVRRCGNIGFGGSDITHPLYRPGAQHSQSPNAAKGSRR